MPWGRIDDGFYDHPKLDALGRDRLAAVGLHWLAVSWSNRWLTDGAITRDRVVKLGGTIRLADVLVKAGLWDRDGDDYRIHDFLEFNESKADVEAARKAEREKKRRQRAAGAGKAAATGAVVNDPGSGRFVSPGVSPRDTLRDSLGVSPSTVPLPSRPDHTRPDPGDARDAGRDDPDDDITTLQKLAETLTGTPYGFPRHGGMGEKVAAQVRKHGLPAVEAEWRRIAADERGMPTVRQLVLGADNVLNRISAPAPAAKRDEVADFVARVRAEVPGA
jgi:hypothetical protein